MTIVNVNILGELDQLLEEKGFRYIKVEKFDPFSNAGENSFTLIPLKYWGLGYENELLLKSKDGSQAFIRGRIEKDEEVGLYVLVERISII